jgi:hypothetical protein
MQAAIPVYKHAIQNDVLQCPQDKNLPDSGDVFKSGRLSAEELSGLQELNRISVLCGLLSDEYRTF